MKDGWMPQSCSQVVSRDTVSALSKVKEDLDSRHIRMLYNHGTSSIIVQRCVWRYLGILIPLDSI